MYIYMYIQIYSQRLIGETSRRAMVLFLVGNATVPTRRLRQSKKCTSLPKDSDHGLINTRHDTKAKKKSTKCHKLPTSHLLLMAEQVFAITHVRMQVVWARRDHPT